MMEIPDAGAIRSFLREVGARLALEFSSVELEQLATHFSLLLKWNRRMNLTSLRRPEEIVWRHFGESLFLLKVMQPRGNSADGWLVDVGSGAGFPGLPIKILRPDLRAVLLEPNQKKATFLKEVIRHCRLEGIGVRAERVEDAAKEGLSDRASLVTMRAVAGSEELLDALRQITRAEGQVALFLGSNDVARYQQVAGFAWLPPVAVPQSERRVILIGTKNSG